MAGPSGDQGCRSCWASREQQSPNKLDSHSLRIGGATALYRHCQDVETVKRFGRWASSAVHAYLSEAHEKLKGLARLMASSGSTLAVTGASSVGGGNGDKLGQSQTDERKPRRKRRMRAGGDGTEAALETGRPAGYEK